MVFFFTSTPATSGRQRGSPQPNVVCLLPLCGGLSLFIVVVLPVKKSFYLIHQLVGFWLQLQEEFVHVVGVFV